MSITTTAAVADPNPQGHPDWCRPDECHQHDGTTIHRHTIGAVAGVTVKVEQVDEPVAHGIRVGRPMVHVYSHGNTALDPDMVDRVATLATLAGMFAAEVAR